ncbi:MAG: diacylglycerol kinase family lipid kinase [Bacteroidales bacterium]|nr:diacylglycerol kinase family lipid kinase [Bacteroidales bacterium]MDD4574952.1 diacylglycerol kinase family lipid kinase [Bacteroidales bacterium]
MEQSNRFWHVILNPVALNGKRIHFWNQIAKELMKDGFEFIEWVTTKRENAIDIAESIVKKGGRHILVVGGDGTLNEVVNGVMKEPKLASQILVCVVPSGTGNDWAKTHQLQPNAKSIRAMLLNGKVVEHDVGIVHSIKNHETISRFFINIAGFGFDAAVIHRLYESRKYRIGNKFIYIKNVLATLFTHHSVECIIEHDGLTSKANVFSVAAGICKYNGNGMKQVPMANFQDGFLDFVFICKMSRWSLITQVPKLFSGKHLLHPKVFHIRTKKCNIIPLGRVLGEVEGEMLEEGSYQVEIAFEQLKFLVPSN